MRSEKGSITIYVLIAMLTFSALLMAIYVGVSNREARQIEIIEKIKAIYENYNKEEAYATITGAKPEILGYEQEVKVIKIKTLIENGLAVDQNGKEIVYYAGTTNTDVPSETSKKDIEFGKWQKSNEIAFPDIEENIEIYIWIKNEDGIVSSPVKIEIDSEEYNSKYLMIAGGYSEEVHKKYVDSNGKVAYIPAGFTVSNVQGEKTIDEGLVIYDDKITDWTDPATLRKTYNQYVWIPVENPSDMYGIDEKGNKLGKLYKFESITESKNATRLNWSEDANTGIMKRNTLLGSMEPVYLEVDEEEYNNDGNGNKVITVNSIQDDFGKMINSIEKYKGFYIGRYELGQRVKRITQGVSPLTVHETDSYGNLRWYGLYRECKIIEKNNIDAKDKVNTSMIWGCQWDQAIKVILDATKDISTGKSTFLTNPEEYSVCNVSTRTKTGSKKSAYNIFDMSGNVADFTIEAYEGTASRHARVTRGGWYGYTNPASDRADVLPRAGGGTGNVGTRAQLYL